VRAHNLRRSRRRPPFTKMYRERRLTKPTSGLSTPATTGPAKKVPHHMYQSVMHGYVLGRPCMGALFLTMAKNGIEGRGLRRGRRESGSTLSLNWRRQMRHDCQCRWISINWRAMVISMLLVQASPLEPRLPAFFRRARSPSPRGTPASAFPSTPRTALLRSQGSSRISALDRLASSALNRSSAPKKSSPLEWSGPFVHL